MGFDWVLSRTHFPGLLLGGGLCEKYKLSSKANANDAGANAEMVELKDSGKAPRSTTPCNALGFLGVPCSPFAFPQLVGRALNPQPRTPRARLRCRAARV